MRSESRQICRITRSLSSPAIWLEARAVGGLVGSDSNAAISTCVFPLMAWVSMNSRSAARCAAVRFLPCAGDVEGGETGSMVGSPNRDFPDLGTSPDALPGVAGELYMHISSSAAKRAKLTTHTSTCPRTSRRLVVSVMPPASPPDMAAPLTPEAVFQTSVLVPTPTKHMNILKTFLKSIAATAVVAGLFKGAETLGEKYGVTAKITVSENGKIEVAKGFFSSGARDGVQRVISESKITSGWIERRNDGQIVFSDEFPQCMHQRFRNIIQNSGRTQLVESPRAATSPAFPLNLH